MARTDALDATPELVNNDCYGEGWFVKVKAADPTELETLMDSKACRESVSAKGE